MITADRLPPPLDNERYYCVFGDVGSSFGDDGSSFGDDEFSFGDGFSLLEGNLIPGVNFTDLTCNYSFTVGQFSNGSDGMCV